MSNSPLWSPSEAQVAKSNLTAFMQEVQRSFGVPAQDYAALWEWSVRRPDQFWPAVWTFCDVRAHRPWNEVLVDSDRMPGAKWFRGARLNFAENLLRHRDERPAIVFWNEEGRQRSSTYAELYQHVARVSAVLRDWDIGPGDRIAALMPNIPETVVAMLAAASVGATFSSCSPDFGVTGVLDRFGQIEPRVMFVADRYKYGGKWFPLRQRTQQILEQMPTVRHIVEVPYDAGDISSDALAGAHRYQEMLERDDEECQFTALPFDHPLYVLYSSGTTGVPKCIVHGAGGTLLQHQKEHVLHTDLTRSDRLFYFTTCGWMMWNWLVSALATGATIVLYDGAPTYPHPGVLFDMADAEGITVFGTSAKYLAAIEKAGVTPAKTHHLGPLRAILSTGSPLSAEGFDFVYEKIKGDLCLASISGGTDIVSCFALGNPIGPVWRGELQVLGLGMDVAVLDEQGTSVVGHKGELVCRSTFPCMPVGFWNDPNGEKYRAAYFERFENVWCHGDYAELTDHGGMIIYGRSDAVLNPGGVRIGTAEIYRPVEQLPEVVESLVVGQDWNDDVRLVLFVRLRDDLSLDIGLIDRIKNQIRSHASPRHVPAKVIQITDVPRTRSGKIVELAVRDVIHGRPVQRLDALANPEALDQFRDLPELNG